MKITAALKAHLVSKGWVAADASDDAIRTAVGAKLMSGELTTEQVKEFSKESAPPKLDLADIVGKAVDKAVEGVLAKRRAEPAAPSHALSGLMQGGGDGAALLPGGDIRVKSPFERYSANRIVGKHATTGEPVVFLGRPVEHPSELDTVKLGAFMRYKLTRPGSPFSQLIRPLDESEKQLLDGICHTEKFWAEGRQDPLDMTLIDGMQAKAILDDGTSGGTNIIPYFFDNVPITFPLLFSELLPFVDISDVPIGDSTKGGSIGNPTVSWGSTEGTAFTLFNTASLIGAFATTFYPVVVGLEIGIDAASDTPMQLGTVVQNNIGMSFLQEMDNVIANGSGTDRPQGVFNASGTTAVAVTNPGGPLDVADAENLLFGVAKQYRAKPWNIRYLMNDVNYARLKSIQVSPTDARRVFGMNHEDYTIFNRPVAVQNNIANTNMAFVALMKYKLYRRRGWSLRTVTEGQTLALKNTILMVGRARFGGKLSDGAAMSVITTAPA